MRMYTQVYYPIEIIIGILHLLAAEKVTMRDEDGKRQVKEFESHLENLPSQREKNRGT